MEFLRRFVAVLAAVAIVAVGCSLDAVAQAVNSSDIDALVAPIALYPDALVAQVLGAATYPDQIVEANNWVKANPNLKGDVLMQQVDKQPWDPSVKAITQFPSVLEQMANNLSWTSALGDAVYNAQPEVMAAVQRLRAQAKAAGNLKSTEQIKVVQQNPQTIVIEQAQPQVVYVPQYNPTVVYGTPYNPPGYSTGAMVATGLISFGLGIAVGAAINNNSCCGWGWYGGRWGCNWYGGHTVYQNNIYISRTNNFYQNNRYTNINNRYANNPRYNNWNQNRPTTYNSGNRGSGNTINRGSGNTINKGGNTVNINNPTINTGNNRPSNNAANRPGANANTRPAPSTQQSRPNTWGNGNSRPNTADRGYGQKPAQANNNSAISGYKPGGVAHADANRGRASMGANNAKPASANARPAGGANRSSGAGAGAARKR